MQIPDCDHVTRLILLQQLHRLGLVDYSPLDDPEFVMALGGEGVEPVGSGDPPTGPNPQKNFSATTNTINIDKSDKPYQVRKGLSETGDPLGTAIRWRALWEGYNPMGCELLKKLKDLEIYRIEVRVLDRFERSVLRKVAHVMEVDRVARNKFKREWIKEKRRKRRARRAVWSYEIRKKERERVIAEYEAMKKKAEVQPSAVHEEVPAIDGDPPSGDNDEAKRGASLPEAQKEIIPGDISTYPTGPWPEGTVERVGLQGPAKRSMAGVGLPVEVELEVIRVGPNPRVLVCRYQLMDKWYTQNVWVKTTRHFRRGMKFWMEWKEEREWRFEKKLPRFLGRW